MRKWARDGCLQPGARFVSRWGYDQTISARTTATDCLLEYRLNGEPIKQRLPLAFLCPGCGRRCARLYSGQQGFNCRACYLLAYKSQGIKFGRKPHKGAEKAQQMINKGHLAKELMESTGISRASYFRLKKNLLNRIARNQRV